MCEECGCMETNDAKAAKKHIHRDATHAHPQKTAGHSHTVDIGASVLQKNDELARENRKVFKQHGLFVVNMIGSPGCGKTSIIEALARRFTDSLAVIEGDVQTRRDAERVIRAGSRAIQIETGGACHLDAHTVAHALEDLDLHSVRLLIIENVGNLVCPAAYDLGEDEKAAILSIPEGDDKILKYPAIFSRINALIINKTDLADRIDFNVLHAINECKSLNKNFVSFQVSAKTGAGMDDLVSYYAKKANIDLNK